MVKLTLKEKAAIEGVSYSTMRRMSGGNIQRRYTPEQRAEVIALHDMGFSNQEIADRTSVPKSTVQYWLRKEHVCGK